MIPTDEEANGENAQHEGVEKIEATTSMPAKAPEASEIEPGASEATQEVASSSEEEQASAKTEEGQPNRLYRFAKKLMDRKELAEDTKDLMVAFLSTSDRAKTEMVRMTAREVRNYLDELRLKEELVKLVRSHSLEVKASFSLKPIEGMLEDEPVREGEE